MLKVNELARNKPNKVAGPEEQVIISDCGELP